MISLLAPVGSWIKDKREKQRQSFRYEKRAIEEHPLSGSSDLLVVTYSTKPHIWYTCIRCLTLPTKWIRS